jgi:hypothetical protein
MRREKWLMKMVCNWCLRVAIAASVVLRMNIVFALTRSPFKKRLSERTFLLRNSAAHVLVADRRRDGLT